MSKRKSSADLRHGFNTQGRRPSGIDSQSREMNTINRKPGATNVRSTSSYKGVRSQADQQRNSSNLPGTRKSSVMRDEATNMPKTRFNSASGGTPRLKCFPVESVRKTVANWSYSPSSMHKSVDQDMYERVESPATTTRADTWATNLPSQGYGDTLKLGPADGLVQPPRQEGQTQQSLEPVATVSQQHTPTEQNFNRINQSEAMLRGRVVSPGRPHRPFVPIVAHGIAARDLTSQKAAISPRLHAQESHILSAEKQQQQQREQVSLTAVEQPQRPQIPVCQQISQISRQSAADQPNQTTPTLRRNKVPWKVDDFPIVYDYETQPIGGRTAQARGLVSAPDKKPETQRQFVAAGQPITPGQESRDSPSMQQWVKQQQQQPLQQQLQEHHQQQPHQLQQQRQNPNRRELSSTQSVQNAQQMHQQIQSNMIRQQEMQQRALSQQQQMMVMTQQQMRQRPLAHQSNMLMQQEQINRDPHGNHYDLQQVYNGQLPHSGQSVRTDQMSIPHHRMLMQQRNAEQHDWVHDHQVIGDHPSLRGQLKSYAVDVVSSGQQGVPSTNMKPYEQSRLDEAPSMANQRPAQQSAGIEWQQGSRYPQYGVPMHQIPPVQSMQQRPTPVSSPQYLTAQQERQAAMLQPQASVIQHHPPSQQQRQQQVQITQQPDPSGARGQSQAAGKKYPEFTAEMIRDQELLVGNMRQQKIPEDIMRRQFDTLLSEQRRYLMFLSGQELAEKIKNTPPRRSSRLQHEDQRPDWMERITPARITVQPPQNSRETLNQQAPLRDQERHRTVPEQMKQYNSRQLEVSQHTSNDPRYATISPRQLHIPYRHGMYHSWQPQAANQQYNTGLSASPPATMPPMLTPSQGAGSSPQTYNGSQSNSQCHPVQFDVSQAQCQQQLQRQQPYQRQYQQQYLQSPQLRQEQQPDQLQQMYQIQQQQFMNCQPMQPVEYMTPEQQYQKRMVQEIKEQRGDNLKPVEPWSLLKMKEFRKYIRPQGQNNGLQDAETVTAALEVLKTPEAQKGLEYVAELGKRVTALKLNGTQDPRELEKVPPPPPEYLQRMQQQQQTIVSSNGLCNKRNANNPAPPPKSFSRKLDRSMIAEYPRQYHPREKQLAHMAQGTDKMIAEKENGNVARMMQQNHTGTVVAGHGPAMEQYYPVQPTAQHQYQSQQFGSIDNRCQQMTIPCNGKNLAKPQGAGPIMSYKFDGSEPQYRQQMDQFYRNRLKLKNSGDSNITAFPGYPNTQQETRPIGDMVPMSQQLVDQTYVLDNSTRMAENKETNAQCLTMQQATAGSNHGQPEIREPRTIGGLTYLARKVDYIQNPPLIAPDTLLASRFLQPLVSLN